MLDIQIGLLPCLSLLIINMYYQAVGIKLARSGMVLLLFFFLICTANTGLEQLTLSGHNRLINCARFSPDGKNIVSASWDCTLRVWENVQGKSIRTLRGTCYFCILFTQKATRNQSTHANTQVMERE